MPGAVTAAPVVFTVGHGARPLDRFLDVVGAEDPDAVLDVRRFPGSRRHPHFGEAALREALHYTGIGYEWHGEVLGGRRARVAGSRHTALTHPSFAGYADHMDTPVFRAAVDALAARARAGERLVLMCAETLWWRCHRAFIADSLMLRDVPVVDLVDVGSARPHRLHRTLRRGPDGWPVYDVPDTLPVDDAGELSTRRRQAPTPRDPRPPRLMSVPPVSLAGLGLRRLDRVTVNALHEDVRFTAPMGGQGRGARGLAGMCGDVA